MLTRHMFAPEVGSASDQFCVWQAGENVWKVWGMVSLQQQRAHISYLSPDTFLNLHRKLWQEQFILDTATLHLLLHFLS